MLKEGDRAPAFELDSDAGTRLRLADFKGSPLVVFFYPKDNTPGCTREAIGFSRLLSEFHAAGAKVVGISKDSVKSHCSFRDKHNLTVPLLSDPELVAHKAFGAWGEKSMYGKKVMGTIRSTFVIDAAQRVSKVFPKVSVDGHPEAALAAVRGDAKPAAKKPAAKKPAAKKPAAKKPAAKKPAAKKPVTKAAAKVKPAPKKPAAKKPAAKKPAAKKPAAKKPAAKKPAAKKPAAKKPAAKKPAAKKKR